MSKEPLIDQLDQAITGMLANSDTAAASIDASLIDLLHIARDLRELPRPGFKTRLRAELERDISMSTKTVQFRQGFRTVTPYLLPPSADFVDFAKRVFGAVETAHHTSPRGFHAELQIGDSMLMVGVGSGLSMPAALHVHVPNADHVYQRALEAGAASVFEMREDYGERFGVVQDTAGNSWIIATHLGASYIQDPLHSVNVFFNPKDGPKFIDFLKQAFRAEELQRYNSPKGEVIYASIRIGDSVIEVGGHTESQQRTTMLYLYVPDCDAVYDRAIRAGAQSIHPPADQPYGDRNGGVTDAWGNQWYIATPL